ncbi:short-chain dehydrogenase/reductase SDR [Rickenella mellea]|uniref:Short-chain dehydrogenase/reductase SDR n=1 Tax=Rickenella mellea TaxID=50990 RepID=A0A4Y7Q3N6_9AGAM|nr:short-chain dehydrogenase/reductase SDR [Rickenella mellea]
MNTLEGKVVLIVGGSSGIGFAVAKYAILSLASRVIIASSTSERVTAAVQELTAITMGKNLPGKIIGEAVNAKESASVKGLVNRIGEIDHLVWTSGESLKTGFKDVDLDGCRDLFDIRFWGAMIAVQNAKFRHGGSVVLTTGSTVVKPPPGYALVAGLAGAIDAVVRGLAVDLAPIRVNAVSPGVVNTKLWNTLPTESRKKVMENAAAKLLVKHVAEPDEIAEVYLFLMKCDYITGQRIEVDGGNRFV